jgi:predicted nuclease with TOPRIM domain
MYFKLKVLKILRKIEKLLKEGNCSEIKEQLLSIKVDLSNVIEGEQQMAGELDALKVSNAAMAAKVDEAVVQLAALSTYIKENVGVDPAEVLAQSQILDQTKEKLDQALVDNPVPAPVTPPSTF